MMLLLGFFSIAQICYLPGALLLRCFRPQKAGGLETWFYTFALSGIANTVLLEALVTAGAYTKPVLWAVMAVEVALLAAFQWRSPNRSEVQCSYASISRYLPDDSFAGVLGFLAAGATVAIVFYVFYLNWGTVFSANDDVASWDRWAKDWAKGIQPIETSWYPQLLPANWSISYVLLGRLDIKMFAKATVPFFSLFTILPFFSLYARRRDPAYLFGAAAAGFLIVQYHGIVFMTYGYADIPLACMGFLAFYALYSRDTLDFDDVCLAVLLATGALLTKQGGLFAFIAVLVYAGWWMWSGRQSGRAKTGSRPLLLAAGALAFATVWYGAKAIQIAHGKDVSNLTLLMQGLHYGRSYPARLMAAARLIGSTRGLPGIAIGSGFALLLIASLWWRETRRITLFLIAPFLLAWGFWFSYEVRTASPVLPMVGFVSGYVVSRWVERISRGLNRSQVAGHSPGAWLAAGSVYALSIWLLAGPLVPPSSGLLQSLNPNGWIGDALLLYGMPFLVLSGCCLMSFACRPGNGTIVFRWPVLLVVALPLALGMERNYNGSTIPAEQLALQRQIGVPAVNRQLYALVQARDIRRPIMTDYWFLRALPGLEHLFLPMRYGAPCSYRDLLLSVRVDPKPAYILTYNSHLDADALSRLEHSTDFETVFVELGNVRMLEVKPSALTSPLP